MAKRATRRRLVAGHVAGARGKRRRRKRNPMSAREVAQGKLPRRLYEYYFQEGPRGAVKKSYFYSTSNADAIAYINRTVAPSYDRFDLVALHQVVLDKRLSMPAVVKRNPRRAPLREQLAANARDIGQAIDLFRKFREAEPERVSSVRVKVPKAAMLIGDLDGVLYTTTHGRKHQAYIHKFDKGARPQLAASADGRQLLVLGGRYNFTRDGIVDRV